MPRRRPPGSSVPRRLDRRRPRGNAIDAQRRPGRRRRGEVETIAERRAIALELRKAGGSFRAIARQLGVDVHTAHADVEAELAALRGTAVAEATELRSLEFERLDGMTAGLWPQIEKGNPPAVSAAVRVSERRARLLGLDAPSTTKTEMSGSLGVYAERLAAERELWGKLDVKQLEELAADSQALVDKAMAMARAKALPPQDAVPASREPVDTGTRNGSVIDVVSHDARSDDADPDPTRNYTTSRAARLHVVLPSSCARDEDAPTATSAGESIVNEVADE